MTEMFLGPAQNCIRRRGVLTKNSESIASVQKNILHSICTDKNGCIYMLYINELYKHLHFAGMTRING